MKNHIIVFFLLNSFTALGQMPGSGNCLDFDGFNDVLETTNNQSFANTGNEFTIECWVKSTDASVSNTAFVTNYGGTSQMPFFMLGFDGSNLFFWCRSSSGASMKPTVNKGDAIDGTWHHIAGVRSSTATLLYLDGVLVGNEAAVTGDLSFGTTISIMDHLDRHTSGQIDEIRIWNDVRTQTEIRDHMCQKLSGLEANLELYYRLDQSGTTTVTDNSSNSNTGTLFNMDASTDWVTSGAQIGDESTHSYSVSLATSLNIASANGDDLTADVTSLATAPESIHIYRVDEEPNVTNPPGTQTQLSQNTYYGVSVFGGSGVNYTVVYNYAGHPDIFDENDLELAKRDDNADLTWSQESATLNTTANTLTLTGQTGTEYILANVGAGALPIELLSFKAYSMENGTVLLEWQTRSEINNDYFTVEKSKDGFSWEHLVDVGGAGNSSTFLNYSWIDSNPFNGTSYYRLKQTDFDGQFEYSQVRDVDCNGLSSNEVQFYPNPTNSQITFVGDKSELAEIQIYNKIGQDLSGITSIVHTNESTVTIDLSQLANGMYFVRTRTSANMVFKQ